MGTATQLAAASCCSCLEDLAFCLCFLLALLPVGLRCWLLLRLSARLLLAFLVLQLLPEGPLRLLLLPHLVFPLAILCFSIVGCVWVSVVRKLCLNPH